MGLPAKRRANGLPRAKPSRLKDKRYDDTRKPRLARRGQSLAHNPSDYKQKRKRFLDPTVLAQGMTSRCLGTRVPLTTLSGDEIEKDLRHMEAYANACTAYSQQFFIYHNRALVQSGHFGPVVASTGSPTEPLLNGDGYDPYRRVMPVRIDPEEEKRVALLRKKIASSEAQREILETEYMSLRAHYVYESQRLKRSRHTVDGQLKVLQELVKARGTVVALRRVRCAAARDILRALEHRNKVSAEGKSLQNKNDLGGPEIIDVWNDIEEQLREAEKACFSIIIPEDLAVLKNDSKGKKKKDKKLTAGDDEDDRIVPWECRRMPGTPEGVPILLSQMSSNPEKSAAWSCAGIFGSKKDSLAWDTSSLPPSLNDMASEMEDLVRLKEEAEFLLSELERERAANKDLQRHIVSKRLRNDEMCAMMTLLRGETEAVLMRHNFLLDSAEAKVAAQELHNRAVEERERRAEAMAEFVHQESGKLDSGEAVGSGGKRENLRRDENENDGDDEGEMDDDEEDEPPEEVVIAGMSY